MPRVHLMELEDQPWFPTLLRDAGTAYLRFISEVTGQAKSLVPKLAEALERSGERRIVDLCSGGAGPIAALVEGLAEEGLKVEAELTDLYPNDSTSRAIEGRAEGRLHVFPDPVDAKQVPMELGGFRTLFNAFHHFRPDDARGILQSAVDAGRPIGVFELVSRNPVILLGMLFVPIMVLIAVPFLRPFRWSWLIFTYLIPLIPLLVIWDGIVSCLRVYSTEELEALTQSLSAPGYTWDIGRIPMRGSPAPATYLIGYPPKAS